jgi:hypothetical protein
MDFHYIIDRFRLPPAAPPAAAGAPVFAVEQPTRLAELGRGARPLPGCTRQIDGLTPQVVRREAGRRLWRLTMARVLAERKGRVPALAAERLGAWLRRLDQVQDLPLDEAAARERIERVLSNLVADLKTERAKA